MAEELDNTIEIIDDDGTTIKCELYDIVEFDGKQYAVLAEKDSEDEEPELVLMRYTEEGEESYFETIDEFERVSEYIENLDNEDEDEE